MCMQCVAVKNASNLQQHVGDYDNCEFYMSNVTVFDFNCEGSRGELCFRRDFRLRRVFLCIVIIVTGYVIVRKCIVYPCAM